MHMINPRRLARSEIGRYNDGLAPTLWEEAERRTRKRDSGTILASKVTALLLHISDFGAVLSIEGKLRRPLDRKETLTLIRANWRNDEPWIHYVWRLLGHLRRRGEPIYIPWRTMRRLRGKEPPPAPWPDRRPTR